MTRLNDLQTWFSESIRSEPEIPLGEANLHVAVGLRLEPDEQIDIYREQFWLRHEGALEEDFRGLVAALSAPDFTGVVRRYLAKNPPKDASLAELGHGFPGAVRDAFRDRKEGQFLAQLATLDWSFARAFVAEDSASLDLAALATLAPEEWESASIELSSSLHLHEFEYPVHDARRQLLEDSEHFVVPEKKRIFLAVYRAKDFSLFDKELAEPAFRILVALSQGTSILDACDRVASESEEIRQKIEENLQGWFADFASLGFFSKIIPKGDLSNS